MPKRRDAVLLCGPARRLLAAVARELTRAGVALVIQAAPAELAGARRSPPRRRGGSPIRIVPAVLDGDDASRRLMDEAWIAGKGIDAVVLCVDTPPGADAGDPGLEDWQEAIESRLRGPFFVAKHAAPTEGARRWSGGRGGGRRPPPSRSGCRRGAVPASSAWSMRSRAPYPTWPSAPSSVAKVAARHGA